MIRQKIKSWKYLFLAVLLLMCSIGTVYSVNPNDLAKLRTTKSCPNCDLSYAILNGEKYPNADLTGTNLMGASLMNCDLTRANLLNANLESANISYADLTVANLLRANLGGANMTGTNFSGATWTDGSKCLNGSVGYCKK
jgi:uncharacterized protein YjbI with pentapeptide repeats